MKKYTQKVLGLSILGITLLTSSSLYANSDSMMSHTDMSIEKCKTMHSTMHSSNSTNSVSAVFDFVENSQPYSFQGEGN